MTASDELIWDGERPLWRRIQGKRPASAVLRLPASLAREGR